MKSTKNNFDQIEKSKIMQSGYHNVIKILIVVATDTELNEVIDKVRPLPSNSGILKCFDGSQTYYLGVLGCFPVCLVKTTMMGSLKRDASFSTVTDALASWNIKVVISLGIAFGRDEKKQNIGDILISETLSQYETVKEDKDGVTISRGHSVPASSLLLNRFSQENSWDDDHSGSKVNLSRCELLSGEKLINDLNTKASLFDRFPNAKGGEMEGNGVFAACDKNKVDWIICKSICDWADGNKDDQWQKLAANNSIGYVNHVLSDRTIFHELGIPSIFNEELDKLFYGESIDYCKILGVDCHQDLISRSISSI
jgi:nucleoside phosphorylase